MKPRRILFVAMQHSIHVARWIEMIADLGWDLHMFALDQGEPNPNLRGVTLHMPRAAGGAQTAPASMLGRAKSAARRLLRSRRQELLARFPLPGEAPAVTLREFVPSEADLGGAQTIAAGGAPIGADRRAQPLHAPGVLASVIERVQPDLIHSMEFQHCGYLTLTAKESYEGRPFPPWLATNWGSDIFLFGRQPDHETRIRALLSQIDFYSCECHRDVELARAFGYQGSVLPVLTNTGGFDMAEVAALRSPTPPSRRKLLMIKGYHHFAGRAMTSLKVLERFADRLKDYEIVLYSCSAEPRTRGLELKAQGVLNIRVIDWATHKEIMENFGRARLYMGISLSDAISTSVLESMAMGAFPIQTNTSCCDEWFRDGEGGFIVEPDNFEQICDRFLRALTDDALVDQAAQINQRVIAARLDLKILKPRVEVFYDEAFGAIAAGGRLAPMVSP